MKSLGLQTLFLGSTTGKTSKGFKGVSQTMMFNLKTYKCFEKILQS